MPKFAKQQCFVVGVAVPNDALPNLAKHTALALVSFIALAGGCSAERKSDPVRSASTEIAANSSALVDETSQQEVQLSHADDSDLDSSQPESPPQELPADERSEFGTHTTASAMQMPATEMEMAVNESAADDPAALRSPTRRPASIQSFDEQTPIVATPEHVSANETSSIAELGTGAMPPSGSPSGPFATLPAGANHDAENGYATVAVYFATDRARDPLPLSAYHLSGNRDAVVLLAVSSIVFLLISLLNAWRKRLSAGIGFSVFATAAAGGAVLVLFSGSAKIEKHGVTYSSQRGSLVKGIAKVTVPDSHQRGAVERPSLLRFEFREDQREHIVLTSAIELSDADFNSRLSETVAISPNQDLLVFVHGYNVDFESAIQRTAQIAVDLPFEGVPVCYSWPSQGKVFSYTIDETNAMWTQSHLTKFLMDLANESGARSINVIAHSMGNRPTTGALAEIGLRHHREPEQAKPFDRLVLAAPDIDADQFRRDLAPVLNTIADHVTLYASSDDRALIVSKQVHGYPRAGESGDNIVVVSGIETIDVSGIDLSLLGHSYYGDHPSMLQDLYQVVRNRLPAGQRRQLEPRRNGELMYWQLISQTAFRTPESLPQPPVR